MSQRVPGIHLDAFYWRQPADQRFLGFSLQGWITFFIDILIRIGNYRWFDAVNRIAIRLAGFVDLGVAGGWAGIIVIVMLMHLVLAHFMDNIMLNSPEWNGLQLIVLNGINNGLNLHMHVLRLWSLQKHLILLVLLIKLLLLGFTIGHGFQLKLYRFLQYLQWVAKQVLISLIEFLLHLMNSLQTQREQLWIFGRHHSELPVKNGTVSEPLTLFHAPGLHRSGNIYYSKFIANTDANIVCVCERRKYEGCLTWDQEECWVYFVSFQEYVLVFAEELWLH